MNLRFERSIVQTHFDIDEYIKISNGIYHGVWNNSGLHIYQQVEKPKYFNFILDSDDERLKYSPPIKRYVITSNFGYRARFKRNHYGLDIKGYIGDTIYAAWVGKVRVKRYDANGFGNYVVIRHYNGLETVYGHMTKQLVEIDQEVRSGDPIGLCGNTGRSFGSHLHFETRIVGTPINPALLVNIPTGKVTSKKFEYKPD